MPSSISVEDSVIISEESEKLEEVLSSDIDSDEEESSLGFFVRLEISVNLSQLAMVTVSIAVEIETAMIFLMISDVL